MPEPVAPHPLLMFVIMFALVAAFIFLIWLIAWLTRAGQRLHDPETQRRVVRTGVRLVRGAANSVQGRSLRLNAEKPEGSEVQPVTKGSDLNLKPGAGSTPSEMPATVEELQKLAHMIVLYSRKPNKEAAITEVAGATKGGGAEYQRWSQLFDLALPADGAARATAKATTSKPSSSSSTPPTNSTPAAPVRSSATAAPTRATAEPAT
ncbi:MAG TPA: hypothetical protein VFS21_03055 [Roseiflexaceae bacterium]|nr:hypothetical protein [Roseiflexaceae bacterium]